MPATLQMTEFVQQIWSGGASTPTPAHVPAWATDLLDAANAMKKAWLKLHSEPFRPVCLNVQLPYNCSLACSYCFARLSPREPQSSQILNRQAARAAAKIVAGNCAQRGLPFELVVQGFGEPTMCWDDLKWCVEETRIVATRTNIAWRGHLSTNGQINESQARWIADQQLGR